jgi:hypothetical protein
MFVETYFDEKHLFAGGIHERFIPYPELLGEELDLWQRYLPSATDLKSVRAWLYDNTPGVVVEELEKARNLDLFDRIEIWSRAGDPMAVGIKGGERTRYYSIARWGDAELTLEQVKKRLRIEEWIFNLIPVTMVLIFLFATLIFVNLCDFQQQAFSLPTAKVLSTLEHTRTYSD